MQAVRARSSTSFTPPSSSLSTTPQMEDRRRSSPLFSFSSPTTSMTSCLVCTLNFKLNVQLQNHQRATTQPRTRQTPSLERPTPDFNFHSETFAAVLWCPPVFRRFLSLLRARRNPPPLPVPPKFLRSFPTRMCHPPPMARPAPRIGSHRIRARERDSQPLD